MKNTLLLFFCFWSSLSFGQQPFVTTWEVIAGDLDITIPTNTDQYTYDYTVDFGDGTVLTNQTGDVTHNYSTPGIYSVSISGVFPHFYGYELFEGFFVVNEAEKLISIEQWGDIQWQDMFRMLYGCENLVLNATDIPDLSQVTNLSSMFYGATSFNTNINNWDVSTITNMSATFRRTFIFNQPLNNWDVSNVTNMGGMFRFALNFNQNINNWNISNVMGMARMFEFTGDFNQSLNDWNVSNCTNMYNMFYGATSFNQPLHNWDVSNVTNMDGMFYGTSSFNQNISTWDYSNVNGFYEFLAESNLSPLNYDLFLKRLLELNIYPYLDAYELKYCDSSTRQILIDNGAFIQDSGIADDCSFNYIVGLINYDINDNNCSNGFIGLNNFFLDVNTGNQNSIFNVGNDGSFNIPFDNTGNYDISIHNLSADFNSSPLSYNINFTGQNEIIEDIDFCISVNQDFEDFAIDIFPLEDAVPGFETDYQIVVTNNGTQTAPNLQVTFGYDNNFQSFVSATETPTGNTTNLLTFDFTDLDPFSSEVFKITMINAVPPSLNGGEVLTFTTQVTPDANDTNLDDNMAIYDQTVVNSFDPNDKLVVQGDEIVDEDINQYLDYRIRFQNLGTANAVNIKITDTISDRLDWTTFQPITSSHDYKIEIVDGEQINYYFDNINLPYESLDEEGSKGYITYKIKPKSDVQIGDVIENTAYIYFDFNLPILTNTVSTTVVDELGNFEFKIGSILVYPNPTQGNLFIDTADLEEIDTVNIYNINGKLIKSLDYKRKINLKDLSSGIYFIQVQTLNHKYIKKIIKN